MAKRRKKSGVRRISVTFKNAYYSELQRIAKKKKVSIAWVVRDAVESYVDAAFPLLSQLERNSRE